MLRNWFAKKSALRPRSARPQLECLEGRINLDALVWRGIGAGGIDDDWGKAQNWVFKSNLAQRAHAPTSLDTAEFDANSPRCTVYNTDQAPVGCARLLSQGNNFSAALRLQQPLFVNGYVSVSPATPSIWQSGDIIQMPFFADSSLRLVGGQFEWQGGSLNGVAGDTLNNIYLSGGVEFDMRGAASLLGSNLWIGWTDATTQSDATVVVGGSFGGFALGGNVAMKNNANIYVGRPTFPAGPQSVLQFVQGATSSPTVGGIVGDTQSVLNNFGTVVRDSANNPDVVCGLGINNGGVVEVKDNSKFTITGAAPTGSGQAFSIMQDKNAWTILDPNAVLTLSQDYYQTAGFLEVKAIDAGFANMDSASLIGNVYLYGGVFWPGYNASEANDNMATLNITGDLTLAGSATLSVNVDGAHPGWCDQVVASGVVILNPSAGDAATLSTHVWQGSPAIGSAYTIILANLGFVGSDFAKVTTSGYPVNWARPMLPFGTSYTLVAQ